MINQFKFDFASFEVELAQAIRNVFQHAQNQYHDESIYSFILSSCYEFGTIYPFVYTESCLDRIVTRLKPSQEYKGLSFDNMRWYFRHNWDSTDGLLDLHLLDKKDKAIFFELKAIFEKVNHIIIKGSGSLGGMVSSIIIEKYGSSQEYSEDEVDELEKPHKMQFRQSYIQVILDLDREGVFGKGKQRENILIVPNFWCTSMNEEELTQKLLVRINLQTTLDRYQIEMSKASGLDKIIGNTKEEIIKLDPEYFSRKHRKRWNSG